MFKTHKMGIRYLNGELFSNETQWREDMFRIVYDFYVKAVHCEKKYRDTGMWLPGHGATDDIIFFISHGNSKLRGSKKFPSMLPK